MFVYSQQIVPDVLIVREFKLPIGPHDLLKLIKHVLL
jgi:hypothetical protein